jgi:hypothetical protein
VSDFNPVESDPISDRVGSINNAASLIIPSKSNQRLQSFI